MQIYNGGHKWHRMHKTAANKSGVVYKYKRAVEVFAGAQAANLMFYPCCLSRLWLNKEDNGAMTIWVNRLGTMLQIMPWTDKKRSGGCLRLWFLSKQDQTSISNILCNLYNGLFRQVK